MDDADGDDHDHRLDEYHDHDANDAMNMVTLVLVIMSKTFLIFMKANNSHKNSEPNILQESQQAVGQRLAELHTCTETRLVLTIADY